MESESTLANCMQCGAPLTARELEVCQAAPQRFAGGLFCSEHQRRFSACSAVRGGLPR